MLSITTKKPARYYQALADKNADQAKALLVFYLTSMGVNADDDRQQEIKACVDHIVDAAVYGTISHLVEQVADDE